jgi:hypothetical protein
VRLCFCSLCMCNNWHVWCHCQLCVLPSVHFLMAVHCLLCAQPSMQGIKWDSLARQMVASCALPCRATPIIDTDLITVCVPSITPTPTGYQVGQPCTPKGRFCALL